VLTFAAEGLDVLVDRDTVQDDGFLNDLGRQSYGGDVRPRRGLDVRVGRG